MTMMCNVQARHVRTTRGMREIPTWTEATWHPTSERTAILKEKTHPHKRQAFSDSKYSDTEKTRLVRRVEGK